MDEFPDGVINWKDHVEKSKNPSNSADFHELDSNSAVQGTPRAVLSGNKTKQDIDDDSSSDEMLADVSVGQTNRSTRKGEKSKAQSSIPRHFIQKKLPPLHVNM